MVLLRCLPALLAGALLLIAGCTSAPAIPQPHEYLDEQTGATITSVDAPLVFARDRSERAANLRDYVTVVAASVNRGGKLEYVLIVYVWSTLDPQNAPAVALADSLLLIADDRRIRLNANGKTPAELGIARAVHAPAGQDAKPLVFPADLDTLRFIAAARSLAVQTALGADAVSYELWDDQRPALDRYVRFLKGER
ncbi:MAG TPA: hypothetical protein VK130_08845 [Steroidobacteraceae bacterium]|nr:hypothetical protein [Steroidobacteraceae bacterium]